LGGNDAAAFLINEQGQVMGWSYTSTTQPDEDCGLPLALGSFLWDEAHGMRNLGSFGGTCTRPRISTTTVRSWDIRTLHKAHAEPFCGKTDRFST